MRPLRLRGGWRPRPAGYVQVFKNFHAFLVARKAAAATTELVYRHQIVPALTRGAEVMDQIFG